MVVSVISIQELDNPIIETDIDKIFSRVPFYNDTYTVIIMKPSWKPEFEFIPCVINELSVYTDFACDEVESIIKTVLFDKTTVNSPVFKYRFVGIRVKNNWWCCYFEKVHIWDDFVSYGVCLVFSPDPQALQSFQDKYEHIIQKKRNPKTLKH